jgi:hypothetical protein
VPDIAEQSRSNVRRPGVQQGRHTIRVDFSQQCRGRVLQPIGGWGAVAFDMESESAVEVGQLREGGSVLRRRRRQTIGRRDLAQQLEEVPVE